jgi:putative acyl-CoA dehydrogenase
VPGTHEILNQPAALVDYNLFSTDQVLGECLRREGGGWACERAHEFGRLLGTEEVIRWGFQANENPPVLQTHDRFGHRRDEVEYHPAWHELVGLSARYALHCLPWLEPQPGAYVARCALMMLASQNEAGHLCPVSMTCAALPVLRLEPALAREWEPRMLSTSYDPRFRPAPDKSGVMVGMAMTEKQGGSDVRANTTRAEPVPGARSGREYLLTGHKWFCSAPMCDAFLVLAQAPGGLSCFLLPRWTPEGEPNRFQIQRLKQKLGNRSNASSEVEFDGARASLVGEEGRGVATIIEMVSHTRLDCVAASTGGMRQAVVQALHHARHRTAFGRLLAEQPLMRHVLADLCIESEAATILMMRLARAFDAQQKVEQERGFARLATAVAKYWICKRASAHVGEALECLGGNGYVEESILPRLYREMPLNSVWEGCGNVICLDVLRAIIKEPGSIDSLRAEILLAAGADRRLDAYISVLEQDLDQPLEVGARRLAERLALALQGSLLVRHSIPAVADAFCASRLLGDWGHAYGTLPTGSDFQAILERTLAT